MGWEPQSCLWFQVGSLHARGKPNLFLSLAGELGGEHSLHLNQREKGATSAWPSMERWSVSLFRDSSVAAVTEEQEQSEVLRGTSGSGWGRWFRGCPAARSLSRMVLCLLDTPSRLDTGRGHRDPALAARPHCGHPGKEAATGRHTADPGPALPLPHIITGDHQWPALCVHDVT